MSVFRLAACVAMVVLTSSGHARAASAVADAVMHGDADTLAALLRDGADVDAVQPDGATALHWAADRDDLDAARQLIEAGANPSVANREGTMPLALASVAGNAEMIRLLAAAGADVGAQLPNGETALMLAARTGSGAALEALLDLGADIDATEALRGTTALMWAAAYSNPNAVELLLARGADPGLKSAVVERGRGPYLAPAARERIEEFERGTGLRGAAVALDADDSAEQPAPAAGVGAVVTAAAADAAEAAAAESFFNRRRPRDAGGLTALIFAAREGDLRSVVTLIAHGADVNQTSEYGWTPLLTATQNRYYEVGKFLLEHGADPNIPTEHNVTPLMVASGIGWVEGVTFEWSPEQTLEVVKLLLELGADVDAQDTLDYRTALMGAAHKGRNDVVQVLVDHGADLALRDIGSRDSIHALAGVTWQAIDYADGLVRVGVQSAIAHPETAALMRTLMQERGLPVPAEGRTLDSICITDVCK